LVDYIRLLEILESVCDRPFVKAHADFDLGRAQIILSTVLRDDDIDHEQTGNFSGTELVAHIFRNFPFRFQVLISNVSVFALRVSIKS
jgi:hypothetical protein